MTLLSGKSQTLLTMTFSLASLSVLAAATANAQQAGVVEEMVVIGARDSHTVRTDDVMVAPADTAELLKKMPGANVNRNGELTGVAQYRGMHGDRVNVTINGAHISSGGPNAMDAPLHYAPVAALESLTISRGITPVSAGQETIGGHLEAVTYRGEFGDSSEFEWGGRSYFGAQSVNEGLVGSIFLSLANRNHLIRGFVMTEQADDSDFGGGTIRPSEYQRDRYDLGYSYRTGDHEVSIDFTRNDTGNAGTAALPMDIQLVDSDLIRGRYVWDNPDLKITAEVSMNDIGHWMSNYHLRTPPADGARYRRTYTASDNSGFSLVAERPVDNGTWKAGVDGHYSNHIALIQNPNNRLFFIDNFKDAERNVTGVFLERNLSLSETTGLDIGIRFNQVRSDSTRVAANLNPMNLPAGGPFMMNAMANNIARLFNDQDRSKTDNNTDWFARFSIDPGYDVIWYAGAARKTRSPSYQERYLWLPAESTGGLADGKTYVGNPGLTPEVAHEIEVGFDLDRGRLSLYPRAFIKQVDDFIQGTPSDSPLINTYAQMMANMGMGMGAPLVFSNVEARYTGFDLESRFNLTDQFDLRAVASIVRGERRDIDDNLYRIAPDNLIVAVDYRGNNWSGSLESVSYARQDKVSATNLEETTPGYTIINLSTSIRPTTRTELGAGINNLLDKTYRDHLGAYNRALNPDIAMRERLPGLGRSVYARFMMYF
ncbi:MAG: TonB-dependent receptor [Gammaproteobacteria bacterium]|nr:TonB-dependent receptor [Gammaproteobacteria bacterium]|tara:strand:+ start:105 stop:2243 length:2139 start_codon:yes stop_codon:yes gene_type:complete